MPVKIVLTPEQFMYFTMLMTAAIEEIMDKVSISQLKDNVAKQVTLAGWLYNSRKSGKLQNRCSPHWRPFSRKSQEERT